MNIEIFVAAALISALLLNIPKTQRHISDSYQGSAQEWIAWMLLVLYNYSKRKSLRKDFDNDNGDPSWKAAYLQNVFLPDLSMASLYFTSQVLLGPSFEYASWLVSNTNKLIRISLMLKQIV